MAKVPQQLKDHATRIHESRHSASVGVRRFLGWFGVQRRGYLVVKQIRSALRRVKLVTEPDFESAPIGGRIRLQAAPERKPRTEKESPKSIVEISSEASPEESHAQLSDPTPRLGTLDPANRKPLSI